MNKAIDNIYITNLGVKKNEKVIVFTDSHTEDLKKVAISIAEAGHKFTSRLKFIEFKSTECHGVEPPEGLWKETFGENIYAEFKKRKLFEPILKKKTSAKQREIIEKIVEVYKKDAAKVVIGLSHYSTSHTRFRDLLNRICKTRYASMPLFDKDMLTGPMKVNWEKMQIRSKEIEKTVNRYEEIEIISENGTNIVFSKSGRKAMSDTGIITKPGGFCNLPAGEVYLAPLEGTANGTLVLEWAPTRKLNSPVTVNIKNGIAVSLEGDEVFVKELQTKFDEAKENRNIAELGIGTNDKALRPDNILESEKIFGTIHIAFGDNSSFGGKIRANFHQDFVFFKPTMTLISKTGKRVTLLKKGKLVNNK
ncbi:MAG: aminopeptidase [Nitrospira sp.]|nr:aminopeptidase [bacterium]MBL7049082.1 aminopeptidase [Nitrospira sp.]